MREALALSCTLPAIHYVLRQLKLTYKKSCTPASKSATTSRPGVSGGNRSQAECDSGRMVFMDETGAKTNMTRLRGRSPQGQGGHYYTPLCHWSRTTMIASIRRDDSTAP